ncbi:MAG: hypothetical protein AB3N28_15670, partial [Kordiimonas sp.]
DAWLGQIQAAAKVSYEQGCAIATSQRLVKGYGSTHARGLRNFHAISAAYDGMAASARSAEKIYELIDAALADEDGKALAIALKAAA